MGGNFWDGRATGEILGNPAAEQASGPFLDPVEQALPDAAALVTKVCVSRDYGELFTQVRRVAMCDPANVATNMGKHKAPSLRNVALARDGVTTKAYGHNGYFETVGGSSTFAAHAMSGLRAPSTAPKRRPWPRTAARRRR